ncbi:hypothetical protein HK102_009241, partial [Quaeritorhiza haematococci]
MKDEDLARAMKTQTKELHKLCGKLKTEGLVKIDTRHEEIKREGQEKGRKIPRSFYHIDYKQFVDVVKWKIYKISKTLEKEASSNAASYQYKCPLCSKQFSMLEVNSLEMSEEGFKCDVCSTLLRDDMEGDDGSRGSSEKFTKFINESRPIVELLKQTDNLIIPEYTPDEDPSVAGAVVSTEHRELAVSREIGATAADIVVEIHDSTTSSADTPAGENGAEADNNGVDDDQADLIAQYYAKLQEENNRMVSTPLMGGDDDDEDEEFVEAQPPAKRARTYSDDDDDEEFVE